MLLSLNLWGCGRSDDAPEANPPHDASADTIPKPVVPSFDKTWVDPNTQLTGTWFCSKEGLYIALVFEPGRTVRVTPTFQDAIQNTNTIVLDYEKLNDSRLLLISANGSARVLNVQMMSDTIVLQTPEGDRYQYQQLPPGMSVATAAKDYRDTKAVAFDVRRLAIEKFLARPGLLLTIYPQSQSETQASSNTSENPVPHVVALSLNAVSKAQDSLRYTGSAWYDTYPPVLADLVLNVPTTKSTVEHRVAARLGPVKTFANPAIRSPALLGDFTFDIAGPNDRLQLRGYASGPNSSTRATLWHDAERHDAIIKKFKEESVRVQSMQQAIVNALKDFAVLQGTSAQALNPPTTGSTSIDHSRAVSEDQIILLRDPSSTTPLWRGEIQSIITTTDATSHTTKSHTQTLRFTAATIDIKNDAASLVIPVGSKIYQYQLRGSFVGQWSNISSPIQFASQMQITQATDMATYHANLQAQLDKLKSITPSDNLLGFVPVSGNDTEFTPVALQLSRNPDDTVVAYVYYTLFRTLVRMSGQVQQGIRGPSINLNFDQIPPNQKNMRTPASLFAQQIGRQSWQLQLADTGPVLRLIGQDLQNEPTPFTLDHATDIWKTKHDAMLKQLLAQNVRMMTTLPASSPINPPSYMTLKLDEATGRISGQLTGRGLSPTLPFYATSKPAEVTGRLLNQGQWSGMTLNITLADHAYVMELIVFEKQGKPALHGVFYPTKARQSETYVQFEPVAQ